MKAAGEGSVSSSLRARRLAAAWLDAAGFLLVTGLSLLVAGRHRPVEEGLRASALIVPFTWVLAQTLLMAVRGRSVGSLVAGFRFERAMGGAAPGAWRALVHRAPVLVVLAASVAAHLRPGGPWRVLGLSVAATLVLDAIALAGVGRSLRDRLTALRVTEAGPAPTAYGPAVFSATGFVVAAFGWFLAAVVGAAGAAVARALKLESTEVEVPAVVGAAAFAAALVSVGAFASFRARRFLVGELALTCLVVPLLALEAMASAVLPVPGLQRYEAAGWVDFSVYAALLACGAMVCLVLGSAVGFMVAGDEGLDLSTRFERLVARRHLRLKLSHWLQLAVIATLVPIVVYGLFLWPVRMAWSLVTGRRASRPLPPTVFMAMLTIVGVMFGVMSLTVVLAVMGGFERDLKEKILGTNAHGVVHKYVGDFTEWREAEVKVRGVPGVQGVTPFVLSEVMITTDDSVAGSVLKGIDVETSGQVTDLAKNIAPEDGRLDGLAHPETIAPRRAPGDVLADEREGKAPARAEEGAPVLPGIVIGREMARSLHVWVGDRVTVMNPLGELGPTGPVPRSRTFRVGAVFVSGMYEYDAKFAYIALAEAQKFFRMGDGITGLELRFANVDEARPLMRRVLEALDGFPYRTKDWGEMNRNLFSALRLERVVMFILLSFQVLIACICVIATLVMLVVEKRREVATLKAMGARDGSIMKLFVLEGLIIGAIGTLYGETAGYLFCKLVERFGVGLDPEVYYITRLPVVIEPSSFVAVGAVAMLLVFVATLYPARRGGSLAPVDGFREE